MNWQIKLFACFLISLAYFSNTHNRHLIHTFAWLHKTYCTKTTNQKMQFLMAISYFFSFFFLFGLWSRTNIKKNSRTIAQTPTQINLLQTTTTTTILNCPQNFDPSLSIMSCGACAAPPKKRRSLRPRTVTSFST